MKSSGGLWKTIPLLDDGEVLGEFQQREDEWVLVEPHNELGTSLLDEEQKRTIIKRLEELNQTNSLNSNSSTPRSSSNATNPNDSENSLAGRFLLGNSKNMFSQIDIGLKFINYIEPNPYAKYKVRYIKKADKVFTNRGTQTLYLEREKGFAWEGQHVFDYQTSKEWVTRSQTTASWWRKDRQVLLNQKGVLFQTVSPYTMRAYYLDTNWSAVNEGITFENVGVGVNVRQQLYKNWLFGEIEPRVTWYESDHFNEPIYSLRMMLEMHFFQPK